MAVQKGLYIKSAFFILYGFAIINQGISQEDADYTAEVKIAELTSSKENGYLEVHGQLPKVNLITNKEIEAGRRFFVIDYYFDKDGKQKSIGTGLLCEEITKKSSSELRNKIISTFLFPRQQKCPIKIDKVREPESKMLSFNYDASEVSCNTPWKYKQEIRSAYNKYPLVNLTVSLKMEKKGECAS